MPSTKEYGQLWRRPQPPMNPWKSIVVGIDFSDSSRAALREAVRLANWHQCRVHVSHVIAIGKNYQYPPDSSTAISIVRDKVEEDLKNFCLKQTEILGKIEYHILVGHPFRELCQITHDLEADLLVLGTCNEDGKSHRAGPIAAKCIRKAPVPVLLVRANHDNPYHNILVGIDFSDTSLKALELAAEIAFENQSHLHLIHAYEPALSMSDYPLYLPVSEETPSHERRRDELKKDLNTWKQNIARQFPDLPISTHFPHTSRPSEAMVAFIRENQIDLAVLGTRGRTRLRSLLMGTTAERLIHDCPCSVLTVKPDDFSYPL